MFPSSDPIRINLKGLTKYSDKDFGAKMLITELFITAQSPELKNALVQDEKFCSC
jgi:hypothetical protein